MVIRRWDPFNELRRMHENMDHLWRGFAPTADTSENREGWAIPLDVVQDGDEIIVKASMPGVNPADISVTLENDVLTIRGQNSGESERKEGNYLMRERHTGSFHRSLRLPDTLDVDKAQPRYDQGVLTIAFPRLEAKQARQLTVTIGDGDQTIEEN